MAIDLSVNNLEVAYGKVTVLKNVSLQVNKGEIVALIGANGAGKTTLIRTISGLITPKGGGIYYRGTEITTKTTMERVKAGIIQVPEGRQLFQGMTVRENILLGAYLNSSLLQVNQQYNQMLELFPELSILQHKQAGTLSGGEQQMCAVARGLMANPQILIIDELSLGLAPMVTERIISCLKEIQLERMISMLVVDQDVYAALELAHRGYVLENGCVVTCGDSDQLQKDNNLKEAYLG